MTAVRRRALWLLGAALLLAGLVIAGVVWWRGPQVQVIEMRRTPLVRTLQFSARVATLSRVDIGSTLTGRVAQVRVQEGDVVQAGDVLVQLEDDELRAVLAQAEAAEQQASAVLAGRRGSGRSAAQATLAQTEATQRAASAALVRAQQLVAQGFYSAAQLDEARRAAAVADAQVSSARAQLQASQDAGSDVAQARAQLDVARAATGAARARLAQASLRAPLDARVLVREVEPGQIVQPGKALLSLALAGPTQLVAQVDERFLDQLRPGQEATVVADAFPSQRFAARVLSLAPAVDAQRGAIEVKFALVDAPPAFLREDMTLSVEVETGRRDAALVLPQSALRPLVAGAASEGRGVLVVQDGRTHLRSVRLGLHTLGAVEVLDGLQEGEQVIERSAGTNGKQLHPGQRVRAQRVAWTPAASDNPGKAARPEDAGGAMSNAMGR